MPELGVPFSKTMVPSRSCCPGWVLTSVLTSGADTVRTSRTVDVLPPRYGRSRYDRYDRYDRHDRHDHCRHAR